jgi:rhodanese-related sulfurtransferase
MSASRIEAMLTRARAGLTRIAAVDVPEALDRGAVLVDIRPAAQRAFEGPLPAALVIERNVLEWRCDPTSPARLPQAVDDDVEWVVVCSQGYTSSLAAAALQSLGLHRPTDVIDGYRAISAAGLLGVLATARSPVSRDLLDVRSYPESNLAAASLPPRR